MSEKILDETLINKKESIELSQRHDSNTAFLSLSKLFERATYYGFRSILVLYMVGETIKMPHQKALSIYGIFTLSIIFSNILGAVFGDFLLGNKRAYIIGNIIQIVGMFSMCIPSDYGVYIGLILVGLGTGFYIPNLDAQFGKNYLNKTKLMDSGFTILYLGINVGAFLGALFPGYLYGTLGANAGFVSVGFLGLISLLFSILSKNITIHTKESNRNPVYLRVIFILLSLILVGLFWKIYDIYGYRFNDIANHFSTDNSVFFYSSINTLFIIPISIIAAIVWSYFYSSHFFKIAIGCIFFAGALMVFQLIPQKPDSSYLWAFLFSTFLISVAEIYFSPVIKSIISRYGNPKYLALLMSANYFPYYIATFLLNPYNKWIDQNIMFTLKIVSIVFSIIGVGIAIIAVVTREKK